MVKMPRNWSRLLLAAVVFFLSPLAMLHAAPVLMISIDGLKPEYVTHADEHGLRIPTLRRFLVEGTYAEGVQAVLPTVTYPDHTTLITGVWPNVHGIENNYVFDPYQTFGHAWYWYAGDIRVPTLWDAARKVGLKTASVSWPVSVNAPVDYLLPEFWRTELDSVNPDKANKQETELMAAISRPDNLLFEMEQRLGPYMMGNDTTTAGDRVRTRYSLDILQRQRPGFMTIHLSSLDEYEHLHGPFSAEANASLEAIDGMVAQLIDQALINDPSTAVVIVSDHGFATIHHAVNIAIPFIQAGLIHAELKDGKIEVSEWKAEPWATGGTAAVMLRDKNDQKTRAAARAMLDKLAADPDSGVARILDRKQIAELGGFPDAEFLIELKPGYLTAAGLSGPLVTDLHGTFGTHGYVPTEPEMRASFFVMGKGISQGRNLGLIDMRQIAPTVANLLGTDLPTATQPKLKIAER
jgi:predicted AlkP superfamily pyrophosphatase or phosphodiesterase